VAMCWAEPSSTIIGLHEATHIERKSNVQTFNARHYELSLKVDAWLQANYAELATAETSRSLMPLVSFIRDSIRSRSFSALDLFVQNVDNSRMTITAQLVMMRTLFGARDSLPSWKSRLDDVKKDIALKGEDPDLVLHGLS